MKKSLLILTICATVFISKNINAQKFTSNTKYAFERTAFKRWNKFKPWWYFWFNKYDNEDRRTMYNHAFLMSEWSIYKDNYEVLEKQTDSLYKSEQFKAIDRTANKTWLLKQKQIVKKIETKINEKLIVSLDVVEDEKILIFFKTKLDGLLNKIQVTLDTYTEDSKKEKFIDGVIEDLKTLNYIIAIVNKIESMDINNEDGIEIDIDYEELYKEFPITLKSDEND